MRFRSMAVLLAVALGLPVAARGGQPASQEEPRYDTATVFSFSAIIAEVREVGKGGVLSGLHLIVTNEKEERVEVYVAPTQFLRDLQVSYAVGYRLEITGSKVRLGSGTIVLAREIRHDVDTAYFRDTRGRPYWGATT